MPPKIHYESTEPTDLPGTRMPTRQDQQSNAEIPEMWLLTLDDGSTITVSLTIIVEQVARKIRANRLQPVTLEDEISGGTQTERENLAMAILEKLSENPNFSTWYQKRHGNKGIETRTWPVRQNDGSFAPQTLDQVIGCLIAGNYSALEVEGSVQDQRDFFVAVRQRIKDVEVVNGKDISQEGAVTFKETTKQVENLTAALDALEKQFEDMVLSNMKPVEEEHAIAEKLMEMDVAETIE